MDRLKDYNQAIKVIRKEFGYKRMTKAMLIEAAKRCFGKDEATRKVNELIHGLWKPEEVETDKPKYK